MRAIRLHPIPETKHECPHCREPLRVRGWHIPGMRNLAELHCPICERDFYGDLAAGQALYTPMLLDKRTGVVHDQHGVNWFADWLRDSFAQRIDTPVPFEVEVRLPVTRRVVLLNCLDALYGHSLLKLLNAQSHLDHDVDLILIIPSFLAWMVPEAVAQVWLVDLPLNRGTEWNDWLAREIRRRIEPLQAVSLSLAVSHPRPGDYDIERFTRVKPFPLAAWEARLERPTVTFIWRDDRTWQVPNDNLTSATLRRLFAGSSPPVAAQRTLVVRLAEALRREWPTLDFAITGLSEPEKRAGLPAWVKDLRSPTMSAGQERSCCERYAASHVVIGVHGSNMLLPTAHAGGMVELIGSERWGNFTQDVLFREDGDCRETFFRYRFMPIATPSRDLAALVSMVLRGQPKFVRLMNFPETEALRAHKADGGW